MGVYLSEPNTEKKITEGYKKGITFCSGQMQGWRRKMEDSTILSLDIGDGNLLFAVFDGHGGPQVSKFVQKIFVDQLKALQLYKNKHYQSALDEVFKKIDQQISSNQGATALRSLRQNSNPHQDVSNATGCTANVVLMTPTHYIIANVGDSRSVLCRGGKAIDLSSDHKPQNKEEAERIRKAGGYIHMGRVNGGLNLSRSFGDFGYKKNQNLSYAQQIITCKPEIKTIQRHASDQFIIVGCDGIWQRYVDQSQGLIYIVRQQIKNGKQNRAIIENLLEDHLAKDTSLGIGCDNMTAILIRVNQCFG